MPGTQTRVKNEVRPTVMASTSVVIPLEILIDWMAEMNKTMDRLQASFDEIRLAQRDHIEASRKLSAELNGRLSKLENA